MLTTSRTVGKGLSRRLRRARKSVILRLRSKDNYPPGYAPNHIPTPQSTSTANFSASLYSMASSATAVPPIAETVKRAKLDAKTRTYQMIMIVPSITTMLCTRRATTRPRLATATAVAVQGLHDAALNRARARPAPTDPVRPERRKDPWEFHPDPSAGSCRCLAFLSHAGIAPS